VRAGNAQLYSNTRFFLKFIRIHQLLPYFIYTTISPNDKHEEDKVQKALALIRENPEIKIKEAARQTRAEYHRVLRRLKGIPRSSSRGGHNKKLNEPESRALIK
jgi:hypothetical protein